MSNKKKIFRRETGPLKWKDFLFVLVQLKKDKEYTFLALIATGVYCGLRLSDYKQFRWIELLNKEHVELNENKTGKYRRITINPALDEIFEYVYKKEMKNNPEISLNDYVFSNKEGLPMSRQYINRKLKKIFEKYDIKVKNGGSTHSLRKTFGARVFKTNFESESALVLLSHIFNHSNVQITRRYIGLTEKKIQNVYLSL